MKKDCRFSACDEDEEMETTFTAGFIGLGLIGGSIARALKKYYPDVQILAHTRSRHTTEYALEHGIIDEICDTVDERYRKCDYIFCVHLWNAMLLIWDC